MAVYDTVAAWADQLGQPEIAELRETLEEEKHADALLTELAENGANQEAIAGGNSGRGTARRWLWPAATVRDNARATVADAGRAGTSAANRTRAAAGLERSAVAVEAGRSAGAGRRVACRPPTEDESPAAHVRGGRSSV
jgi:rubrerythrin